MRLIDADALIEKHPVICSRNMKYNLDLAPTVDAAPKWISVKDRMPPRERKVLTIDGHGRIRVMAFWKKEKERWTWIKDSQFTHWNDITHWMPLPPAP